jgi:hypothetical protein
MRISTPNMRGQMYVMHEAARRRRSLLLALVLGAAGVAIAAAPAAAQIAAALGKPLPSPDLAVGTVSVRVVAGSAASPVVGTDVTLVVNDVPREARTDSAGRASFQGLPAGATAIAKVHDEDKAEHASEPFQIPDTGGVRVMITTKPWQGGAGGGAPFAGGAGGGMPNPRQLSGQARGEQADPPGTITIHVTYDDFKDSPAGVPVVLVGYSADDTTSYQRVETDKDGRARFEGLDRSGGTSYFAMALLPRNGATDRLASSPILLDSQVGVRMVLSSEKRDSKAPPIDDTNKIDAQIATPAGKVRVVIEGTGDLTDPVTLFDAATRKPIGEARPQAGAPDESRVRAEPQFAADPSLPPGTLEIGVFGGPGKTEKPMPGLPIRVVPEGSDGSGAPEVSTGADGQVRVTASASGPQKVVLTINGNQLVSPPVDLSKSGGKLAIRAHWDDAGRPQAMFDAPAARQVVYAEYAHRGQHYRSLPIALVDGVGSKLTIYAFPRVLFRFQLDAAIQDAWLAVWGRFEIMNWSWAPYRAGPDGLVVPLPKGFLGGVVDGSDQSEIAVSAGEGFRIMRPIPPGGRPFHGKFSLPVADGKTAWTLDLPMGAFESELVIRQTPGMVVHTEGKIQGESRTVPEGTFYILGPINIRDARSIAMTIDGLPSAPAWRAWLQGVIGILVVGVILGGIVVALYARRRTPEDTGAADEARRQRLLDELVELERTGANPKRREQLLGELEQLWG